MRCLVKSSNERNPCCQLPARAGGDSGETAQINWEEGGDDVRSVWPLCPGLHTYYNAQYRGCLLYTSEGAVDASNLLKPALARGELRTIGATTLDEYRKYIEKDAALERRFQPVMVSEPSVEDTIAILRLSLIHI